MKFKTDLSTEYLTDERCSIIEILNTKCYPEISIAQARVKPGISTADHSLKATDEIYYILSGRGVAKVGEVSYELHKGDALLISKEKKQTITNTGMDDLIFLCICTPRFVPSNYTSLE